MSLPQAMFHEFSSDVQSILDAQVLVVPVELLVMHKSICQPGQVAFLTADCPPLCILVYNHNTWELR